MGDIPVYGHCSGQKWSLTPADLVGPCPNSSTGEDKAAPRWCCRDLGPSGATQRMDAVDMGPAATIKRRA